MATTYFHAPVKRQKILLLYPYYWPHYKAGGPVQSLFNMATVFKEECDLYFLSLTRDIDGTISNQAVPKGQWSKGPNQENIYFTNAITPWLILKLAKQVLPDVIFINGMFNITTTVPGLLWAKWLGVKLVISPRGMLQAWALKRNPYVKKLVLAIFKLILNSQETWHATDAQEKSDIIKLFGIKQRVYIAANVPRTVGQLVPLSFPERSGKIKLVFLSLINANKNIHLIIDATNKWEGRFSLDIFGPVIDVDYWKRCQGKIKSHWIFYRGPVAPWEVQQTLQQCHFFVLPTLGENFGHAIYDALASGVPVIISKNTPWKDIDVSHAGIYMDLDNENALDKILAMVSAMDQDTYETYRRASHNYAKQYSESRNYRNEYKFLLGAL